MNLLSYQLTVFANIDIDRIIVDIAKIYPSNFIRGRSINPLTGFNSYTLSMNNNSIRLELSSMRIDCFYDNTVDDPIKDFILRITQINEIQELNITRIAINYVGYRLDEDNALINKFSNALNLNEFWGDTNELSIRSNNRKEILGLIFNFITTIQNGPIQNKNTFVNQKSIILHIDINNVPVTKLEFNDLENYFNQMENSLKKRLDFCKGIIDE